MRSFRKHLNEKLKRERFKKLYSEERQLAEIGCQNPPQGDGG